jgi:hypothetical protein
MTRRHPQIAELSPEHTGAIVDGICLDDREAARNVHDPLASNMFDAFAVSPMADWLMTYTATQYLVFIIKTHVSCR